VSRAGSIAALSCALMPGISATLAIANSALSPSTALALYAALFLPYIALLYSARAVSPTRNHWLGLMLFALALRVLFAFSEPLFSDDIFRYVWDGRVGAAGINPYIHAPDALELSHLRDQVIWPKINHPEIPTIYPPLAQMVFHLNALWHGGTSSLRMLFVLLEALMLGGCWAIFSWKRSGGKSRDEDNTRSSLLPLAVYVLNPLVLVEGIWSGHIDILAWGTLTLALVMFVQRKSRSGAIGAGLLLGASCALKLISVIFLPLLLLAPKDEDTPRRELFIRRALLAMAMPLIVGASYLPYLSAGGEMFEGFGAYASRWRGNDGPFRALMTTSAVSLKRWAKEEQRQNPDDPAGKVFVTLSTLGPLYMKLGWTKQWQGKTIPANTYADDQASQTVAKLIVAGLMGLMLLWCLLVVRDPLKGTLLLMGTLFFLAPTLYPWYVAWLVPLAALTRHRTPLLFGALSLAAYLAWVSSEAGGGWVVPWWAVSIEFGVVFFAAFYEVTRPVYSSSSTSEK